MEKIRNILGDTETKKSSRAVKFKDIYFRMKNCLVALSVQAVAKLSHGHKTIKKYGVEVK